MSTVGSLISTETPSSQYDDMASAVEEEAKRIQEDVAVKEVRWCGEPRVMEEQSTWGKLKNVVACSIV